MEKRGRSRSAAKVAAARANGARGGRPRKRLPDVVEQYIALLMLDPWADLEATATREAGHRRAWRVCYPAVATHYGIVDGLPVVLPDRGAQAHALEDMTLDEAMRMATIKVAGYTAEAVRAGLEWALPEICEALAQDYGDRRPRLDWRDMLDHGDDIGDVVRILVAKGGRRTLAANLLNAMRNALACVRGPDMEAEVADVRAMLRVVRRAD